MTSSISYGEGQGQRKDEVDEDDNCDGIDDIFDNANIGIGVGCCEDESSDDDVGDANDDANDDDDGDDDDDEDKAKERGREQMKQSSSQHWK